MTFPQPRNKPCTNVNLKSTAKKRNKLYNKTCYQLYEDMRDCGKISADFYLTMQISLLLLTPTC